jgi:microcystin-dependent protein
MATNTISPNMSLVIPVVGQEVGPTWAFDLNASLNILDGHTHLPGSGVQITPDAMNINSDLPLNQNNLITARSARFTAQTSPLALATDRASIYVSGADLYYNDTSGNQVRITQSGNVAGTPGSIANLVSPASAAFVAGNQTFVFQSAANTPGNVDGGAFIFRNLTANSKGVTVLPPSSLSADYSLTLPTIPASQKIMTLDASGNMSAPYSLDNTSIQQTSGVINVITSYILPVGSVIDYAGALAPTNFLICDGSAISRTTYSTLFAVLGTTYGPGDGSTTFNLPNLGGRMTMGVGNSGLSTYTLGQTGGEESHSLTIPELPAHNHRILGNLGGALANIGNNADAVAGIGAGTGSYTNQISSGKPTVQPIENTGTGAAHNTLSPFMALNKIIKYQ